MDTAAFAHLPLHLKTENLQIIFVARSHIGFVGFR